MKRRVLVRKLEAMGFVGDGGTKHEKFRYGGRWVIVGRHNEIIEQTALGTIKDAQAIVAKVQAEAKAKAEQEKKK